MEWESYIGKRERRVVGRAIKPFLKMSTLQ